MLPGVWVWLLHYFPTSSQYDEGMGVSINESNDDVVTLRCKKRGFPKIKGTFSLLLPYKDDYSLLGSILGFPYLRKLPTDWRKEYGTAATPAAVKVGI